MTESRDEQADAAFIEQWAMLWGATSRLPRAAGRIYALLLISDRSPLSADEIRSALGLSAGSVSTMTHRLLDGGWIDRVRVPGTRQDRFQVRIRDWADLVAEAILASQLLIAQIDKGLELAGPEVSPGRRHLLELRGLYTNLIELARNSAASRPAALA